MGDMYRYLRDNFIKFLKDEYNEHAAWIFRDHDFTGVYMDTSGTMQHFLERLVEREISANDVATMLLRFLREKTCMLLYEHFSGNLQNRIELRYKDIIIILRVKTSPNRILLEPVTIFRYTERTTTKATTLFEII